MRITALLTILSLFALSPVTAKAEDVVIVTSGGVSLGSYEAGLNWALIELFKDSRTNAAEGKHYNITGLAGASAGGINTVLGALTWCGGEPTTVNGNLFWKAWIPLGADIMLPLNVTAHDYRLRYLNAFSGINAAAGKELALDESRLYPAYLPGEGLITQRANGPISGVLESQLREWLEKGAPAEAQCELTIGLTLTRVEPAAVSAGGIKTSTQKFILPLSLHIREGSLSVDNQSGFGFVMDRPLPGKPVQLPRDGSSGGSVSPRALVNAIRASAAFPIAFEPIPLSYCDEQGKESSVEGYTCPAGSYLNTEKFSDGGIFNNIPIGLAVIQQGIDTAPIYLAIAPEERSRKSPAREKKPDAKDGSNYVEKKWSEFFSHTVTTAMEAETVLALSSPNIKGKIQATGRFSPIAGAYLAHFGAFFDRPLREYDYYAGVYDGARKFAELSCGIANGIPDDAYDVECVGRGMAAGVLALGLLAEGPATADAQYVFRALTHREFGKTADGWNWLKKMKEEPRNNNLRVIMNALFGRETAGAAPRAAETGQDQNSFRDFITALGTGYSEVNPPQCAVKTDTDNIGRIKELLFEGYVDFSKYRNVCDPSCTPCYMMQDSMRDLRNNYDAWFVRNSLEAIQRLKWLERKRGGAPSLDLKALNAAEFLLRNDHDTMGYRVLRLNASSVPDDKLGLDNPFYNSFFMALPYRIGINTTEGGWILGYEPGIRFNKNWSVAFPVEPYTGANSVNKTFLSVGAMGGYSPQALSGFSAGAGIMQFYEWGAFTELRQTQNMGVRFEIGFLWNKVSIGMTQRNYLDPETRYWAVNFNDINGLIYWALKIRE
ncbi:MAG: patatin-like phospholipase family protein [Nitrospinae bacterium]|nr:patatin-like phospholipase family protein [Nitrospinota bacterium]